MTVTVSAILFTVFAGIVVIFQGCLAAGLQNQRNGDSAPGSDQCFFYLGESDFTPVLRFNVK